MGKKIHTTGRGFQKELLDRCEAGEHCTVRGNDLIADGVHVASYVASHGGRREGAGRKPLGHRPVTLHLGPRALECLKGVTCKSALVESLILAHFDRKP